MKIALCLSGTVGKIYTNKKQYEYDQDVDYRIGLEHYKRHLFKHNDVDVFMHCWDKKYEKEIVKDYNPKSYVFEDQISFNKEEIRQEYIQSRWYSQKQVLQLKKNYEESNNFTYDYVMVARFDQAFLSDLIFKNYDNNKFWAPIDQETVEKSRDVGMFLDYFFFSNSKNMDKFGAIYDYQNELEEFKKTNKLGMWTKKLNAHEDAFIFAAMHKTTKFNIDYMFVESKDHDLVRAIYEDCEYKGNNFKGIDSLKKYSQYPRHNGRF